MFFVYRLVAATEDAFAHIRRLSENEIGKPSKSFGKAMEAKDAAEVEKAIALSKVFKN